MCADAAAATHGSRGGPRRSGGEGEVADGVFNRSQPEDARGPRAGGEGSEDYQEINSKTGLTLLTSQGGEALLPPWDPAANTGLVLLRI